ncbi:MAG: rhomboid family intramembrane serine protease, partial [Flavobacteriia bacterium]|nr:rhomboid family intramembrane serine protease [Flavobacteriia bacterium]
MAIGFTPKHLDSVSFNELTQSQLLVLAHKTTKKIGWKIEFISESGLIATTDNGLFSWNAEIEIRLQNNSLSIKSTSTGNELIDWGRNKKNVTQFVSVLGDLKSAFSNEELDEAFLELKPQLALPEEDVLQLPPPTGKEQLTGFLSIFKPVEGYFITPILVNLNLLIFIAMIVSGANIILPDNDTLLNWGANFRPSTLDGEWWRIITNCFLHIGIIHLLMNMYALIYIGMLLEPILGKLRFLSAYLFTGIMASLASLWWHDLTISAGASGAIFGMFGVFLALLTTTIVDKSIRKSLLNNIAV